MMSLLPPGPLHSLAPSEGARLPLPPDAYSYLALPLLLLGGLVLVLVLVLRGWQRFRTSPRHKARSFRIEDALEALDAMRGDPPLAHRDARAGATQVLTLLRRYLLSRLSEAGAPALTRLELEARLRSRLPAPEWEAAMQLLASLERLRYGREPLPARELTHLWEETRRVLHLVDNAWDRDLTTPPEAPR